MLADVRDVHGSLVTVHATYLEHGRKLSRHPPRKFFSTLNGYVGCAARLGPFDDQEFIGIAEGIETALSAAQMTGIPTWAALSSCLLAKFEPPASVRKLVIFADRDHAGMKASATLDERLRNRLEITIRWPYAGFKDFNDELTSSGLADEGEVS